MVKFTEEMAEIEKKKKKSAGEKGSPHDLQREKIHPLVITEMPPKKSKSFVSSLHNIEKEAPTKQVIAKSRIVKNHKVILKGRKVHFFICHVIWNVRVQWNFRLKLVTTIKTLTISWKFYQTWR